MLFNFIDSYNLFSTEQDRNYLLKIIFKNDRVVHNIQHIDFIRKITTTYSIHVIKMPIRLNRESGEKPELPPQL